MLTPDTLLQERYQITYIIEEQPDSVIYRALDRHTARPILIAALSRPDLAALQTIQPLAQHIATVQAPALLPLRDSFASEGAYYLVADDPEGQDLERVVRADGSPPPEAQRFPLLTRLLATLETTHAAQPQLCLGDLRSTDLWFTPAGALYVAPFGFARRIGSDPSPYRAPELHSLHAQPSPVSDIYALGAVAYLLLTGWLPPTAEQRLAGVPLNAPRTLNAQISPLAEQMVLRALDLTPANRYQQARELRCALDVVRLMTGPALEMERAPLPPALPPVIAAQEIDPWPAVLPANTASDRPMPPSKAKEDTTTPSQPSSTCLLIAVVVLAIVAVAICIAGIWLLTGPAQELLR